MSLKDGSFGPYARHVDENTVAPFTKVQDRTIREFEFPEFCAKAYEVSLGSVHTLDAELERALRLFLAGFEAYKLAKGGQPSFFSYCKKVEEGMKLGAEKYGVDWPFCDNMEEACAEARDIGAYAFLDQLKAMWKGGQLDGYKGWHAEPYRAGSTDTGSGETRGLKTGGESVCDVVL